MTAAPQRESGSLASAGRAPDLDPFEVDHEGDGDVVGLAPVAEDDVVDEASDSGGLLQVDLDEDAARVDVAYGSAERAREPRRRRLKVGPLRGRLVRRTVRQVDPWSVFRLGLLFFLAMWVVCMIAAVILWRVAVEAGLVGSVEDLIEDLFQQELFRFEPDILFRATALGGLALALGATALATLMAVLFNLIADLVGGIRVLVVEEERSRRWLR